MPSVQRVLIGRPLPSEAAREERLNQPRAMGAFGIDALSSVAYGPDEIFYVLLLAGAAGSRYDVPVATALALLLAILVFSYRQTIQAYPHGGGSFTVARENLGVKAGLVAASALMVDYVLTVAVSVTAGVQAIGTFVPVIDHHRVISCVLSIFLLVIINLRGVREAGAFFVAPVYLFVGSMTLLLAWSLFRIHAGTGMHPVVPHPIATQSLSIVLVLRAFASGCAGLTGVEAVANGVPMFREPEAKNAVKTLTLLGLMLALLLVCVSYVGHHINAVPSDKANVISQIASTLDVRWLFYVVQLATGLTLLLAANTPFNGFPMLAAVMAKEEYFPHQFQNRGQRLAYSNGIIVVGALSAALLVAFNGSTHAMIPLYAVGVFLCFTLSQMGMVKHWQKEPGEGRHWRMAVNGTGAVVTGVVTLIVVGEKLLEGAWLIVVLVPLLVALFASIRRHYDEVREELQVLAPPRRVAERAHVLVPVNKLDRSTVESLEYAMALNERVHAVHISTDEAQTARLVADWEHWQVPVALEIVPSPYRDVVGPLVKMLDALRLEDDRGQVTLIVPEVVPHRWWHEPLHNQTGLALELALRYHPGVVVTTVPVRLLR